MKKTLGIFILFFLLALLSVIVNAHAQSGSYTKDAVFTSTFPGDKIEFECALDSVDADTSRTLSLARHDGLSFTDHPISAFYKLTSAAGTPKISTYIDGTFDGVTWFAVDTLLTDATSETATKTTITLNNHKYPFYRMRNVGVATNNPDSVIRWIWYLYYRD